MFGKIIHFSQVIACIWLSLSVISGAMRKNMMEAKRKNTTALYSDIHAGYYQPLDNSEQSFHGMLPAFIALALTFVDILLSLF